MHSMMKKEVRCYIKVKQWKKIHVEFFFMKECWFNDDLNRSDHVNTINHEQSVLRIGVEEGVFCRGGEGRIKKL